MLTVFKFEHLTKYPCKQQAKEAFIVLMKFVHLCRRICKVNKPAHQITGKVKYSDIIVHEEPAQNK